MKKKKGRNKEREKERKKEKERWARQRSPKYRGRKKLNVIFIDLLKDIYGSSENSQILLVEKVFTQKKLSQSGEVHKWDKIKTFFKQVSF